MGQLDGKVAIVTGAARGIGRGIALAFANEGAAVTIADRDEPGAKAFAGELAGGGARAIAVRVDVTKPDQIERMVARTKEELGGLDILVNNAGIDTVSKLVDMPLEQWQEMMDVNLTSVFLCTKACLPTMIEQRWGRIISIGSQLGLKGAETMVHYCAAKAGVHGFTRALALEVAPYNVTVNAIAAGAVETALLRSIPQDWLDKKKAEVPLGRFGQVEEITPTAVLLASDGGSYYTGSTLNVSGGDAMV
ncbi:MAG TPA: 3-oxoacyl-ACP reductase family protein [Actinomycetota bacterium]|nr:3-oxoacyl-ACP reductase family protein [Actinomycetota bacterium]